MRIFRGTSDVPLYERSDLVDAVVLLPSSCGGVARFERAQQDVSNFKKRIDANTEEQREHADLMVALQRKVHFCFAKFLRHILRENDYKFKLNFKNF